jgi:hypothetical protein
MEICHPHNLNRDLTGDKPYGFRVSLPAGDSLLGIIGADWSRQHWFSSAAERDRALENMREEHLYSRLGDRPRLVFVAVDPESAEQD